MAVDPWLNSARQDLQRFFWAGEVCDPVGEISRAMVQATTNKVCRALTSPMTPWILLCCVVSGVVGTVAWWKVRDDHEGRRWKDLVKAKPNPAFDNLLQGQTDPGPIPLGPIDWGKPHVAVYSVPGPRPPREHPTLRDLSDSGQAHAIDFLSKNPKSEAKSWAELQSTLTGTSDADAEGHDPFRFDRVLVATVAKGANWDPGDRMVWTRVLVQPINFAFAGYKVAETENETLKVTSVEDTKTRKFSANLGLTIPGLEGPKGGPRPEQRACHQDDCRHQRAVREAWH
jgi:hypothetical protein